jgi:hypothetical protein
MIRNCYSNRDQSDEDHHGGPPQPLVIDFLHPQRDRRTLAWDRYFTSQEADEGDPLCYKDPDAMTTDIENHIGDD